MAFGSPTGVQRNERGRKGVYFLTHDKDTLAQCSASRFNRVVQKLTRKKQRTKRARANPRLKRAGKGIVSRKVGGIP